jgi:hypothetical protein
MNRSECIEKIRAGLKRRSDRAWSVTGRTGTAYGWIRVSAPPRRCVVDGYRMSEDDRSELARLLGLESVSGQGVSIPASTNYYAEYIERAEGRTPSVYGTPYWD